MNTRLQVEHPVTEEITGLDLVEWQFRIAAGEKLPLTQDQIGFEGHAIEARVYAEDPEHDFLPSTGRIVALELPKNIRVDSGVETGGEVPPFYDPMLAKIIAHAPMRDAAVERLATALDDTLIAGVRTNVAFLATLCRASQFRQGKVDTGFIDRNLTALGATPHAPDNGAAAVGALHLLKTRTAIEALVVDEDAASEADSPWSARDAFQLGGVRELTLPIVVDGEDAEAVVSYGKDGVYLKVGGIVPASGARVFVSGGDAYVLLRGRQTRIRIRNFSVSDVDPGGGDKVIKAPMHGRVLELLARVGDHVALGQRLAVIEAMKMEHTLRAPFAGVVSELPVSTGTQVVEGAPIMVLEPVEASAE
jgi:3-methylcrotonyl-CoA carboxylase alpha subunit